MILKNGLGASTDAKLTLMRGIINSNKSTRFPYEEINQKLHLETSFNDSELENLLQTNYGTRYSYLILSLLYPGRDWKDRKFNEDHIFPQSEFQRKKLKARGYSDEKINQYLSCYNTIGNLELLEEAENKSKNAKPFEDWLKNRDSNFMDRHLIPQMKDYSFDNFLEFIEQRKALILTKLKQIKFN